MKNRTKDLPELDSAACYNGRRGTVGGDAFRGRLRWPTRRFARSEDAGPNMKVVRGGREPICSRRARRAHPVACLNGVDE